MRESEQTSDRVVMPAHPRLQRFFFFTASLVLIIGLLYWAQPVFVPIAIAILLTFILSPPVSALERLRMPRSVAIFIVVIGVFGLLAGIGALFYTQAKSLAVELPKYKKQIDENFGAWREQSDNSSFHHILDFGKSLLKSVSESLTGNDNQGEMILVQEQPSSLPLLRSIAGPLLGFLVDAILVMILVFFMLFQREDLRNRMVQLGGPQHLSSTTRALNDASQRVSRFLFFQLVLNTIFGIVLGFGLFLIGIPFFFIWGMMVIILRYVPYLGIWIAASLPLIVSLGAAPDWDKFFMVASLFLAMELIHSNLVEPVVFGHSIGISGVAFLVAALFWTWLWGAVGLVLSMPLTACLFVFGRHVPSFKPLTLLMGEEPPLERHAIYYQRLLARDPDEAEDLIEEYMKDHTFEQVHDEILLPALQLARRDRQIDELSERTQNFIVETTRDVLYDVIVPSQRNQQAEAEAVPAAAKGLLLGVPARDPFDALVLEMFKQALPPGHFTYIAAAPLGLQVDVHRQIGNEQPTHVLLVASPADKMVRARSLCKKIRHLFPEAKFFVNCWGVDKDADAVRAQLKDVGADAVCVTFAETLHRLQEPRPAAQAETTTAAMV